MDKFQTIDSGSAELKNAYPDLQKDALSEALRQRRLNKSNKRRLTPTNDSDEETGDIDSGSQPP